MTTLSPNQTTLPREAPQPRRGHLVLGGVLVVAGLLLLLIEADLVLSPWPALPALVLAATGVAIVVEGARGIWHGGLATIGVILTLVTAVSLTAVSAIKIPIAGSGDRVFAPESVTELQTQYELGAGTLLLDLRDLDVPEGTTSVSIDVGMGEARLRVPEGAAVQVSADTGAGEVELFGVVAGGLGVDRTFTSPVYENAGRRLEIEVHVGMGRIEVTR